MEVRARGRTLEGCYQGSSFLGLSHSWCLAIPGEVWGLLEGLRGLCGALTEAAGPEKTGLRTKTTGQPGSYRIAGLVVTGQLAELQRQPGQDSGVWGRCTYVIFWMHDQQACLSRGVRGRAHVHVCTCVRSLVHLPSGCTCSQDALFPAG